MTVYFQHQSYKATENFFSVFFKVYETSKKQISHSNHEQPPSNYVKKSQFIVRSNLSCSTVFFHQYFIQTTTTDFDMFLQFLGQFCNYIGFVAISDITMLFCSL